MKRAAIVSLFVVIGAGLAFSAYAQDLRTVLGTVVDMDTVGSLMVVNTDAGMMTFKVPEDKTKMIRGTEEIHLDDIDISDSVTVQFYSPSPGEFEAVSITDNNLGNE